MLADEYLREDLQAELYLGRIPINATEHTPLVYDEDGCCWRLSEGKSEYAKKDVKK